MLGGATTCTATVTAASEFLNGEVGFASDAAGGFDSGGSCTLVIVGPTISRCEIAYTPDVVGSGAHQLTATYAGDGEHDGSQGSAAVAVAPPAKEAGNPGQAGKKKCKKKKKRKKRSAGSSKKKCKKPKKR